MGDKNNEVGKFPFESVISKFRVGKKYIDPPEKRDIKRDKPLPKSLHYKDVSEMVLKKPRIVGKSKVFPVYDNKPGPGKFYSKSDIRLIDNIRRVKQMVDTVNVPITIKEKLAQIILDKGENELTQFKFEDVAKIIKEKYGEKDYNRNSVYAAFNNFVKNFSEEHFDLIIIRPEGRKKRTFMTNTDLLKKIKDGGVKHFDELIKLEKKYLSDKESLVDEERTEGGEEDKPQDLRELIEALMTRKKVDVEIKTIPIIRINAGNIEIEAEDIGRLVIRVRD